MKENRFTLSSELNNTDTIMSMTRFVRRSREFRDALLELLKHEDFDTDHRRYRRVIAYIEGIKRTLGEDAMKVKNALLREANDPCSPILSPTLRLATDFNFKETRRTLNMNTVSMIRANLRLARRCINIFREQDKLLAMSDKERMYLYQFIASAFITSAIDLGASDAIEYAKSIKETLDD